MRQSHSQIQRLPQVLGGTPVFAGTRVPVQTALDYLEGGECIDDFLSDFPTVKREQVVDVLEELKSTLLGHPDETAA